MGTATSSDGRQTRTPGRSWVRTPWPWATPLFALLLLAGMGLPTGEATDRVLPMVIGGLAFVLAMTLVGWTSAWTRTRHGWVWRGVDWFLVLGAALIGGYVLGFAATIERLIFCVDESWNPADCHTTNAERFSLVTLGIAGWCAGAWVALRDQASDSTG